MTDPIWTWTHDIGSQSVHNQSLTSQEKTYINIGLNKIRHDTSHHGNVFRITDLCEGIHWWTAVPPNNGPVMQRFDVFYKLTWNRLVLMWRHCCKTSTFPAEHAWTINSLWLLKYEAVLKSRHLRSPTPRRYIHKSPCRHLDCLFNSLFGPTTKTSAFMALSVRKNTGIRWICS